MKHSTLTMGDAVARKSILQVDTGRSADLVKVKACAGTGPYTVTVRPVTWLDRAWMRLGAYVRRPWRAVRHWRLTRCDARFCWRPERFVDADWNGYCGRHKPDGAQELPSR
jgi:hypothetical protein